MCCNNAFCNADSNIENFTEVKKGQAKSDQGVSPVVNHKMLGSKLQASLTLTGQPTQSTAR